MSWLLSNWETIAAAASAAYGVVQRLKAGKARAQAARTALELDLLRAAARTKAPWEGGIPNVPVLSDPRKLLGLPDD